MKTLTKGMTVALFILVAGLAVGAQDAKPQAQDPDRDTKEKIEDLNARLKRLEQEKPQVAPGTPKPSPGPEPVITATFADGVHFKSDDGNFDVTLGGYAGIHYRFTADRHDDVSGRTTPDAFFIRQVRPELNGNIYKDFDFRVQYDFPTSTTQIPSPYSTGTLQDGYVGWHSFPEISFRIGQFKEPFGQEETTPDRWIDFDERSEGDRFTPQRDLGAELYGSLAGGIVTYEAGYFNGQGRAVIDQNKGKEEAGRIRFQPFAQAEEGFVFKYFRFGVAGTVATVQQEPINSSAFNNSRSASLNIQYFNPLPNATNFLDGGRTREGLELTWNWGPFGLRGEAWKRTDEITTNAADVHHRRFHTRAWMVEATILLTGETKPIEARIIPTRPFDVRAGTWGALEFAVKVDRLDIDRSVFSVPGVVAAPPANANAVTEYAVGFNWYLTRNIRVSPDVFWEVFGDRLSVSKGSPNSPGNQILDSHFFGGIVRFQLEF